MRSPAQVIGYRVMAEAGVAASEAFHLVVMRNQKFYGLFAFVEEVDHTFLKVRGRHSRAGSQGGVRSCWACRCWRC
jgi:hypothetical protein